MMAHKKKAKPLVNILRNKSVAESLDIILQNSFSPLFEDESDIPEEMNSKDVWNKFTQATHKMAAEVKTDSVARRPWISDATLELVKKRTKLRQHHEGKNNTRTAQKLKEIRKKVAKAAKRDKNAFYTDLAEKAEKASRTGQQREVYKIIDRITGKRAGAADLTGVDIPTWLKHFKSLLGEQSQPPPDAIKEKLAWKKAQE
jgi:hypothetical protein